MKVMESSVFLWAIFFVLCPFECKETINNLAILRVLDHDYLCVYLSTNVTLPRVKNAQNFILLNMVPTKQMIESNYNFTFSSTYNQNPQSYALGLNWKDLNLAKINQIKPTLLILVYNNDEISPELNSLNKIFPMNQYLNHIYVITINMDTYERILSLGLVDQLKSVNITVHKTLSRWTKYFTSIQLQLLQPFDYNHYNMIYDILVGFILYLFALCSILIGTWIVIINRNHLLEDLAKRLSDVKHSSRLSCLVIVLLLIATATVLIISYFFYDIVVYISIFIFCMVGTFSTSRVLSFIIQQWIPLKWKMIRFNRKICGRVCLKEFSNTYFITVPIAITIVIVWLVYRNEKLIGWPIQSVIGIFVVGALLSTALFVTSLKIGLLLFSAFVIYDILFVFMTPLLTNAVSQTLPPPRSMNLTKHAILVRSPRSTNIDSVMEAVATGTAGKSGELLPATFRLIIQESVQLNILESRYIPHSSILGFGDAAIPGLLIVFFALYDSCWQIKLRRHFVSSLIGYTLGFITAFVVLYATGVGQPALIYLCPFTLILPTLVALIFGNKNELIKLWSGNLPVLILSPPLCSSPHLSYSSSNLTAIENQNQSVTDLSFKSNHLINNIENATNTVTTAAAAATTTTTTTVTTTTITT